MAAARKEFVPTVTKVKQARKTVEVKVSKSTASDKFVFRGVLHLKFMD